MEDLTDRATWGPGPWEHEQDRYEWRDDATGLPCLILRGPLGALCGYAAVPPGHPLYGKDMEQAAELEVHGGITYSGECNAHICHEAAPGEPDKVWWLGFDCAHGWDFTPGLGRFFSDHRDRYRDVDYVRVEVARLAAQLAAVTR